MFTILIGNATRMMRFKGRQEGEEFHVEMRRVVVKRGREAGRQQGQWSRRGGPANRQTNISLWTQRSISPRRREIFSRSRPRNYISQHPLWQGRSQTLRPGIVDILQTVEHLSSSFHSGGKMLFFRGLPDFFGTFSRSAFLVNKMSLFLPNCQ